MLPQIESYGEYASNNYGAHSLRVTLGVVQVWFSYQTIVAFCTPKTGLVVSENCWGTTTGKHLNWIDQQNKSSRVSRNQFEEKWREVATVYGFDKNEVFA